MRSGAAAGHVGMFHEAAFYDSDDDLLAIVVPFVQEGHEAGEPTLVTLDEPHTRLVQEAVGDLDGIEFLLGAQRYVTPASTIRDYRRVLAELVAGGPGQVRVVGDVPHPGSGAPWGGWARYEAAVNHALDDFPLWGLCPYDVRTAPDDVLDDVARTHAFLADADGGHRRNPSFEDPATFLRGRPPPPPDPLEATHPMVRATNLSPRLARAAVAEVTAHSGIDETAAADLVTAASEVVTNANLYGALPVELRGWAGPDRAVVSVHDRGRGPDDAFAGLVPVSRSPGHGGLGLWLAHQLCAEVTMNADDDGFCVRLVAGWPCVHKPATG